MMQLFLGIIVRLFVTVNSSGPILKALNEIIIPTESVVENSRYQIDRGKIRIKAEHFK